MYNNFKDAMEKSLSKYRKNHVLWKKKKTIF